MSALDYLKLARPKDWAKNAFVLMPIPFALAAGGTLDVRSFVLGVAGFSLVTSAVYATNDALDAERDRAHEKKRHRPVASGRVSPTAALAFAFALLALGVLLAALSGVNATLLVIAAYVAKELGYQLGLKHVPLVDVFLLSSGFVLRVVLGALLVGAEPSSWLLLCSSTLALFI
jgi:decaprenyl-phosphate phosphoribosyltransferase